MMEDLGLVAELFKTSSTLSRAAFSLEKMITGQNKIDSADKDALLWSGKFLLAVDWDAKEHDSDYVGGGLTLQATSVRPTFYSSLFRLAPQLREAGVSDTHNLKLFLNNLYRNLLSPKMPGRGHKNLTSEQYKLGALLLHEIAESILVQINNNGLPRPTTTLKNEWKPTANEITPAFSI